jgi:DNA modification methylase
MPWRCLDLGEHRVLCGDATVLADVEKVLDGELADMAFTDPPYNVNYGQHDEGQAARQEPPILNDASARTSAKLLYDACVNILTVTKGAVYICMSSSELDTLQKAFREAGGKWSTFVIWAKNTFTLGRSDYQRQYEPILYGWKDGADHYWCGARDQGDVWFFDKPVKNDLHPTMKPVALVERAIRNSSKSRDIVLDPFGGSGTTLIAARSGRAPGAADRTGAEVLRDHLRGGGAFAVDVPFDVGQHPAQLLERRVHAVFGGGRLRVGDPLA